MMAAAATVAHRALASGTLLLLLAPLAGGRSPGPAVSGHVGNQLYLYSDACIYPHEHVGMPYLENTSPALHVHVFDDVARARAAAAMGRQRAPDGEAIVSTVRNKWPRWNGTRWGQQLEIHHHAAQQLQGRAHVWSRAPALVLISGTLEDNLYHVLWDGFLHAAAHVAFLRNYTADSYVRSAVANSTRGKAKQRRLLPALNLNRRTRAERRGRQQFGRYDVLLQGIGLKPPLSHREMLTPHAAEQLEMMISSASTLATPLSTLWCFRRIIAALAAPTMSQPSVAVHWPPSRFLMHGAMRAWGLRCPGHRPHGGMYTPRQVANISLLDRTHGRTLQNLDTIVGAISKEVGSMAMINVVLPERLTLRQQLVLFYCHTDILVGRHGAGLGWAHAMARTRAGLEVELRSRPVLNTSWMAGRPFTPGLLELRGHWVTHRSLCVHPPSASDDYHHSRSRSRHARYMTRRHEQHAPDRVISWLTRSDAPPLAARPCVRLVHAQVQRD